MAETSFSELMKDAEEGKYAVGYFETWTMESLEAAADAAEKCGSPVILGFSGICLPHPERVRTDDLSHYASLLQSVVSSLKVPACTIFNESADYEWVLRSIELGFDCVMFTDPVLTFQEQLDAVAAITDKAHQHNAAVEGEVGPLPGAGGEFVEEGTGIHESDVARDVQFAEETGIDAFAVDIGQEHVHGRRDIHLDFQRLKALRQKITIPLVLHGASSVPKKELEQAISFGIRKINVGSSLKRVYFEAMRAAAVGAGDEYNPYEVIGSGLEQDVLMQGRLALERKIVEFMNLFGSAGRS